MTDSKYFTTTKKGMIFHVCFIFLLKMLKCTASQWRVTTFLLYWHIRDLMLYVTANRVLLKYFFFFFKHKYVFTKHHAVFSVHYIFLCFSDLLWCKLTQLIYDTLDFHCKYKHILNFNFPSPVLLITCVFTVHKIKTLVSISPASILFYEFKLRTTVQLTKIWTY